MKSASHAIVAALLQDAPSNKQGGIAQAFGFVGAAWEYKLPDDFAIYLMVEGDPAKGITKTDKMVMGFTDVKRWELGIAHIEQRVPKKSKSKRELPEKPHVMLGVGSLSYCQAFIHYWATSSDGDGEVWGLHLLRMLSQVKQGTVVWFDTRKKGEYWHGEVADMVPK